MSRFTNTLLGSTIGVLLGVGSAFGNPVDPTVTVGSASFETVGSQLNITNTPGAVIDWQSFSVGQDEITRFIQESASSAVLNRVTGGNLSEILGDLHSNGRVFLINPNGLIIGDGAVIDTAGFIASTLALSNEAFASGQYSFNGTGGAIENRGLIHVTGNGDIALIASSVENSGVLRSDNGDILLAAGRSISLSFDDFQDLHFEVQAPENAAINLGDIIAGGGNASLVGGRINNSGNVELVASPDGRIFLQAIDVASVSGSLKASGADIHVEGRQVELRGATLTTSHNDGAGNIALLGDNVGLFAGTNVDASGDAGGGTVLIGGEQQGRGNTRTSEFVYLDKDASVSASGGASGDGGTVILFAENSARVHGALTARGGAVSGDGGFIETSGLIGLDVTSAPDAGATNGEAGTWLIDPNDIHIFSMLNESLDNGPEAGVDVTNEASGDVFTGIASGAIIHTETIVEALASNNVTIDTGTTGSDMGDITINDDIVAETNNSLTFNAAHNIFVNASVRVIVGDDIFIRFNSGLSGSGGATILGAGALLIESNAIEFLGGGATLTDTMDLFTIVANQVTVEGGLSVTNALLNFDVNTATIDELNLIGGIDLGGSIISGVDGVYTVDTLSLTHSGDGSIPGSPTFLTGGSYTITGRGSIDAGLGGGAIPLLGDPGQIEITADIINQGVLDIRGLGLIDIGYENGVVLAEGSLVNESGATLNLEGGVGIHTNQALLNNGSLNVSMSSAGDPIDLVQVIGDVENNDLININSGATFEIKSLTSNQSELHLEDGGILSLFDIESPSAEIDVTFGDGSSITGNGVIQTMGTIFFESGAVVAPGNSPGTLVFDGNATFFDGAVIDIELAGPTPAEYDFIQVFGDLSLGGAGSTPAPAPGVVLNILNLDEYDPNPTDPHNIISVGGMVLEPGSVTFNQAALGFDTLDIAFNGNELDVQVSITPPPPPPAPETPAPETPAPETPAPETPEPETPEPETPEPETPEPVIEQPQQEEPTNVVFAESDIINDVVAVGANNQQSSNRQPQDSSLSEREERDEEIKTLENQCR